MVSALVQCKYYPMLSYGISVAVLAVLTVLLTFYIPEVCFAVRSQSEIPLYFSSGPLTLEKFQ